jgi:hypothetical protein
LKPRLVRGFFLGAPNAGGGANRSQTCPAWIRADSVRHQHYRLFGELRGIAAGWDIDGSLGWMYAATTQTNSGYFDRNAVQTAANNSFNFVTASPSLVAQTFAPPGDVKDLPRCGGACYTTKVRGAATNPRNWQAM